MRKLGFDPKWIIFIMTCIRSITYSILINGQPGGKIFPTRGIKQGDPLSPYLFILCVEALSGLLLQAERSGYISGVPTSKHGPRLW
jgi:hypothetical protein